MKLVILLGIVGVSLGARLDTTYLPPRPGGGGRGGYSGGGGGAPFGSGFSGSGVGSSFGRGSGGSFGGSSAGSFGGGSGGSYGGGGGGGQFGAGSQIKILRYDNDNDGSGNYHYAYETENGIQAEETGRLKNAGSQNEAESAEGSFSYTGPDGQRYSIQYVADENGFRPVGAHLPTPPPIPEAILKSLQLGDDGDDGQYRPGPGSFGGSGGGGGGRGTGFGGGGQFSSHGGYQY